MSPAQRPPINYYGSKVRLAPWIAPMLPSHRCYVEPFFGSGAVLFAKAASTHEIVSDKDATVVNFFKVLRDRPRELARACMLTPYARDEYSAAVLDEPGIDELERARRFWARSGHVLQPLPQPAGVVVVVGPPGSNDAVSAVNISDRLLAVADRLRWVAIDNAPATKVVAKYGVHVAVIYADPPYVGTARRSLERIGSPTTPASTPPNDHRELAEVLRATEAVVLLSGYASTLYDEELYPDWWRVEREVHRPSANRPGRGESRAVEVIWSNRPLPAELELGWACPDPRRGPAPAAPRARRTNTGRGGLPMILIRTAPGLPGCRRRVCWSWLVRGEVGDTNWKRRGACRGLPAEMFFPPERDGPARPWSPEPALAVCRRCPVAELCREWALVTRQNDGVWGGLTEAELRRLRHQPRRRAS